MVDAIFHAGVLTGILLSFATYYFDRKIPVIAVKMRQENRSILESLQKMFGGYITGPYEKYNILFFRDDAIIPVITYIIKNAPHNPLWDNERFEEFMSRCVEERGLRIELS